MIHSFRKHGASPTAPARVPRTPRCRRMVPGPPATAPPPYARLTLWLLRAVPRTPPGSQAQTPARFGKEPVGPQGARLGEGEAGPGGSWGLSRRMRAGRKGAVRMEEGVGAKRRPGTEGRGLRPPHPRSHQAGGLPWAARLPVPERRVSAHPPLLPGPYGSESVVHRPRRFLPGRAGI